MEKPEWREEVKTHLPLSHRSALAFYRSEIRFVSPCSRTSFCSPSTSPRPPSHPPTPPCCFLLLLLSCLWLKCVFGLIVQLLQLSWFVSICFIVSVSLSLPLRLSLLLLLLLGDRLLLVLFHSFFSLFFRICASHCCFFLFLFFPSPLPHHYFHSSSDTSGLSHPSCAPPHHHASASFSGLRMSDAAQSAPR